MADASLAIQPAQRLPDASPSLMPFHIAYTGPAPFSTYFRVAPKPTPEPAVDPEPAVKPEPEAKAGPGQADSNLPEPPKREVYTATFRGRTVEGTRVALPEGYGGLVLQSDSPLTAHTTRRPPSPKKPKVPASSRQGRRTRSSTVPDENEPAEADMDVDEPTDPDLLLATSPDTSASRSLVPTGKFDSFLVWGADFAVDEVSDEYIRALNDWTRLAAEIHKPLPIS
ncbi:hypothetical protein AURDEDRAFT_151023 [Auricularia subglabra TFB-10046 SS5]|nr:hypothetical protein AURDEDRAFT_151023 [Auricularia subglabra TFB-10046 SS5]